MGGAFPGVGLGPVRLDLHQLLGILEGLEGRRQGGREGGREGGVEIWASRA